MLTWLNCSLMLVCFDIPFAFCLSSLQGSSDFCINPDAYVSKVVEENAVLSAGECWDCLWHGVLQLQLSHRTMALTEKFGLCLKQRSWHTVGKKISEALEKQHSGQKCACVHQKHLQNISPALTLRWK